ncbi:MAG: hypothetical protein J6R47_04130, partial [Acholeplasmatales bacterium]|nr:hypothetical protein [Acholeplasmatales bacterium]
MKLLKKLFLAIVTLTLAFTLAACDEPEETVVRNQEVPYAQLALDEIIAQSGEIKLTTKDYYNRLRSKSYDTFVKVLKDQVYSAEINAIKALLNATSIDDLTSAQKLALSINGSEAIDFEYLKDKYHVALSIALASSIYGTNSSSTFLNNSEEKINNSKAKYVLAQARQGFAITVDQISHTINNELGLVLVDYTKIPEAIVNEHLRSLAETLYGEKELFKIADIEEMTETNDEGEEETVKNNHYYFKEATYQSTYETEFMNYGTYEAVVIQFNSHRDAKLSVAKALETIGATEVNDTNYEDFDLALYNTYYNYRGENISSFDHERFEFVVNEDVNELNHISSAISTFVTDTLEDGDYLLEPRNVGGNYVMAYRISTTYEIGGTNEQVEYNDLTDEQKDELLCKIQRYIIESKVSTYSAVAFRDAIEAADLKIYDPFLEYKFKYSYTSEYETIAVEDYNANLIFKLGDFEYSVADFYNLLSARLGEALILEYFSYEYVYQFADEYLTAEKIEENEKALNTSIESFENDANSTYPVEIGLETYLLTAFGYPTKEQVLKYYYTASTALTSYKGEVLFDEWAIENHEISDDAKRVLNYILAAGNATYSELFSINIDHVLINIDDNGDGTPDNPADFLSKNHSIQARFEAAVVELAKAIYEEATHEAYAGNTYFETMKYIVKQYNKGEALLSNPAKTWDDYKEFNFLITTEQLSSSSDITQDSVSNFVTPFADYVKAVYNTVSTNQSVGEAIEETESGEFVLINPTDSSKSGIPSTSADITYETLCATSYGYHMIVVNSFEGPDTLEYKESDDTYGYQKDMQILISKGEDEKSDSDNIYVTVSSYNDVDNA